MRTKEEILAEELNLDVITPLQFDGIMRAMDKFAQEALDKKATADDLLRIEGFNEGWIKADDHPFDKVKRLSIATEDYKIILGARKPFHWDINKMTLPEASKEELLQEAKRQFRNRKVLQAVQIVREVFPEKSLQDALIYCKQNF
jgi:hypothetical protein